MKTIVRFNKDQSVELNEIYEVLPGFDDDEKVDEDFQLDESLQFNEDQSIQSFLSQILNVESTLVELEGFSIDQFGNIFGEEFIEDGNISFGRNGSMKAKEFKEGDL